MLAVRLMAGVAAAPLAALSLAQGSSALAAVGAFGTGGTLAIVASGLIVAVRTP